MFEPTRAILLILTGLLLLAGCARLITTAKPDRDPLAAGPETAKVSAAVPPAKTAAVSQQGWQAGSMPSSSGCTLDYRLFRPQPADLQSRTLVVLGHGFLRSQERMRGLAEALAREGLPVVTLDYCNMRPWNGAHRQNGQDMIALAQRVSAQLGTEAVIYSGFSAGALAALVAAREDPRAIGVVTLDLVDADDIGTQAAAGLNKPLIGFTGEPTNCNAQGNGQQVFAASPHATQHRITGASHCDFESPTDRFCRLLCDAPSERTQAASTALRQRIITQTTAAIQRLAAGQHQRPDPAPEQT